jgi:hypothetical protein
MRARVAGLALCAAGLALSGCGTGADQRAVRATTERFYAAVHHHDGSAACGLLGQPPPDCASSIVKLSLNGTRAASASVYATSAQVKLDGGDVVFLGWTPDGWRIDAAGCHVVAGGGPLQCEEKP